MNDFKATISSGRTFIMGCAMISILLFHQFFLSEGPLWFFWGAFHRFGHWGVDIFLFVSGFGIVHSLRKNSLKVYFSNRLLRLLPSCLIAGLVFGTLHLFGIGGMPVYETNSLFLIFTSLWLWYVFAILIYYAVAPFALKGIDRWGGWVFVAAELLFIACTYCLPTPPKDAFLLVKRIPWVIQRFPVFVLGMWLATKRFGYSLKVILPVAVCSIVAAVLIRGCRGIGFIKEDCSYLFVALSMPAVCWFLGLCKGWFDKLHIAAPVEWLGKYSLELYIVQWPIFNFVWDLFPSVPKPLMLLLALMFACVFAYLLKLCADWVTRLVRNV